jgi:hypothetical protein
MNKLKVNNKNKSANKSNLAKIVLLTTSLLFTINVFANEDVGDIMLPGGGGNPNNAPAGHIDTPYFWVLMLIMGVIIGYKRFKSNMT